MQESNHFCLAIQILQLNHLQLTPPIYKMAIFIKVVMINRLDVYNCSLRVHSKCLFYLASQVWTLGRYLPLLIGDLIPSNNLNWECFLHLHDILGICMSPCISPATISYLSELIQIHHSLFTECYPSVTMTPRFHYMVHFPEQINRLK